MNKKADREMTVEQLLIVLDIGARSPSGIVLTPEQASDAILLLNHITAKLQMDDRILDLLGRKFAKAVKVYQRGNPGVENPNLAIVINWLLEYGNRSAEIKALRLVDNSLHDLLDLGTLSYYEKYQVDGYLLIKLRTNLMNVISQIQETSQSHITEAEEPRSSDKDKRIHDYHGYGQGEVP